jgi:hypothetical protein
MDEPKFVIAEITDPAENERRRLQVEQAKRNSDWLSAHWSEVYPGAVGQFLAVVSGEAFVGASVAEVVAKAKAAHPDDAGMLVEYVRPNVGPRIYGNRG